MAKGAARAAGESATEALAVASQGGAEREAVHAAITLAVVHAQLGDPTTAVGELRHALENARALDDLELVVRGYGNLTYALGVAGRFEEVADVAADGVEFCRRYGPVISLASNLRNNHIEALLATGRWVEAAAAVAEALGESPAPGVELFLHTRAAEIAVARGDLASADQHLARAAGAGSSNPYALSALTLVRTARRLVEGDAAGAVRVVGQAMPALLAQDDPIPLVEVCAVGLRAYADLAELAARRSVDPGAEQLCAAARQASTSAPAMAALTALFLTSGAEFARITGADAATDWTAAEQAWRILGRPYPQAYCAWRAGAAELRARARAPLS